MELKLNHMNKRDFFFVQRGRLSTPLIIIYWWSLGTNVTSQSEICGETCP